MKDTLINNFLRISKIPRMSGNEKQISDFFVEVAKNNNLDYYQDENNNLLIKKKGNITGDTISLQAHLDMVCVKKEGSSHNFNSDGIDVIINGDGVTVEEETTFKGSITFPYDKVSSKKMINLDYCMDNAIVVASAGDKVDEYIYEGKLSKKDLDSYKLIIKDLSGGNSGENIEASGHNAIITLINSLLEKDVYIKSINGGTFENDVATNCEIVLQSNLDLISEFSNSHVTVERIDNDESFSLEDTKNIINQILELKSGFISKTASGNLGMIKTIDNKIVITYLYRSTNEEELNSFYDNINNEKYNFRINKLYDDRIWKLNKDSYMFNKYKEIYNNLFHDNPIEIIAQGGLEIASIQKRIDGLDIISIGANMENIHTVDEITYISSWEKLYDIIINLLKSF